MKRLVVFLLCVCLLAGVCPAALATDSTAEELTDSTTYDGSGYNSYSFLHDGDIKSYKKSQGEVSIVLDNPEGMGSIYLMFDLEYGSYTVTNNSTGQQITAGSYGFLHEFIDLSVFDGPVTSLTLDFENGSVSLSEIRVFAPGTPPADVQIWQPPLEGNTDLLLMATHGDDEQLFFAGLLPYYAAERNVRVQVAYLTDHRNLTKSRTHEMLNGLWTVGVTAYPVFGRFHDFLIESKDGTYNEYARLGTSKEELLEYVVEQLRRFRPQVVVGHDLNGEYAHGMHMVYADLLTQAAEITNDPSQFPALAEKYGTWDIPKIYLHLYEENPIVMDWDTPMESFNGLTAFEVTQKLGYPCHESQQYTWFTRWINGKTSPITKASQIETYSPCNYGLYRSTVGADILKNDFLENITTYEEQERLEQERLEQERLEQERLEQEQLEQERLEQERLEQERQEQLAQENAQQQQQLVQNAQDTMDAEKQAEKLRIAVALLVVLVIALIFVIFKLRKRKKQK